MLIPELIATFLSYCSRHRTPATLAFYRARLKKFCREFNARELASLTPLEIDEHLAKAGAGMSNSTRNHDAVALQRLQKFALEQKLLDKPVIGKLESLALGVGIAFRPLPKPNDGHNKLVNTERLIPIGNHWSIPPGDDGQCGTENARELPDARPPPLSWTHPRSSG